MNRLLEMLNPRVTLTALLLLTPCLGWSQDSDDDEDDDIFYLPSFQVSAPGDFGYRATAGATPGGAQDINFVRSQATEGEIPSSEAFLVEGLLSEHDLPLGLEGACEALFCIGAKATATEIPALPDVDYLAQVGFSSSLVLGEWQRPPLNLVAVVDKSGSMSGAPLGLVKDSLLEVVEKLGPQDQLSVVLYGDRSYVHMEPTRVHSSNVTQIRASIHAIESAGSTYMEAGLRTGVELAERSGKNFEGSTRIMLFTDERPNVGRTDADSFMGIAREASRKKIGITTIGVARHFGAELAAEISSVRGGNLFYFSTLDEMRERFADDFDFMVTELAYDLTLRIAPADGMTIAGIWGIPGDLIQWDEDGALSLEVETIFLSRNRGAIYVGFASSEGVESESVRLGTMDLEYTSAVDGDVKRQSEVVESDSRGVIPEGLVKGRVLINEYASIQKALLAYEDEETKEAFQVMRSLQTFMDEQADMEGMESERAFVDALTSTFAFIAGDRDYGKERLPEAARQLVGNWRAQESKELWDVPVEYLSFYGSGYISVFGFKADGRMGMIHEGPFRIEDDFIVSSELGSMQFKLRKGVLRLELPGGEDLKLEPVDMDPAAMTRDRATTDPVTGLPRGPRGKR